jgi:probable rRNA maturation factor
MKLSTHTITTSSRGDRHRLPLADSTLDEPPSKTPKINLAIKQASNLPMAFNAQWLRERIELALPQLRHARSNESLAKRGGNISILIADDQRMMALHRQFMGLETATDVLTFDLTPDEASPVDIEIAVGIEVAQRQAAQRGHAVERELLLYAIHGLLHTLGYDDHDKSSYARMHAEEDRILSAIGVGATFQSMPPDDDKHSCRGGDS